MEKLKKIREYAGYLKQKDFALAIRMDHRDYCKAEKGRFNLLPEQFRTVCAIANVPPCDIATPDEVDYGIPIGKHPARAKRPDKRKNPCRMQCRVDEATHKAFIALCRKNGKTVNDMLAGLIQSALDADGMEEVA